MGMSVVEMACEEAADECMGNLLLLKDVDHS